MRTQKGQELLRRAVSAGRVVLRQLEPQEVLSAQLDLLARRRQLFGRLLGMRLMLTPTPRYKGFSLLRSWIALPLAMKLRTILGTMRRVAKRGLWRRRNLHAESGMRKAECEKKISGVPSSGGI